MDQEEDFMEYEESTEEENSDDEENFVDMGLEHEQTTSQDKHDSEEFPHEILTADQIVQFMVDCIKEVNAVVQVIMIYYW